MGEVVKFHRRDLDRLGSERPMFYDKWGDPIFGDIRESVMRWAALNANREYAQIMDTYIYPRGELRKEVRVSTIWVGIDYNFGFGIPHTFETMIFGGTVQDEIFGEVWEHREALGQWRWHSVECAREMHMALVKKFQDAVQDPITRFVQPSLRAIENTVRAVDD